MIPTYTTNYFDHFIQAVYEKKNRPTDITSRVDFFSQLFLDKPYLAGAQGEGVQGEFDQSPLYRFDQFDCVTYVNNVLALTFSNNLDEFKKNILRLNYYHADPTYENRFHFMSIDWNPQNQRNGFLKDMTTQISNIVAYAEGDIDKPNWFLHRDEQDIKLIHPISQNEIKKQVARLRHFSHQFQKEWVRLPYLPLTLLLDHEDNLNHIPHGSVIEIVRPNWDLREKIGTRLHVSHVGFAIRQGNELYFRHASSEQKKVTSVLLIDYLRSCSRDNTIKGIHIQSV